MNQPESDSKTPFVKQKDTKKLNFIQVYRGVAALLVVLTHANLIFKRELNQPFLGRIFDFGWSGVDFFFVLSGFIIFYIHQHDIGRPSKFKSFILKRFIRIYPLYWIILTCKIAASLFLGYGSDSVQPSSWDYLKAITLYPQENKQLLFTRFLGVTWTLSFEIFFYLLFGLLILLGSRFLMPFIIVWLFGCFLNLIGFLDVAKESFMLNFVFNERNLEFIFGILSAYIVSKYQIKRPMILISVAAFFLTIAAINSNYSFVEIPSVVCYGIPFMILLVGSVVVENSKSFNVPNSLILLGDSSYAIYLMHGFIISNISKLIVKLKLGVLVQNVIVFNIVGIIIAIITVAVGCAIYRYVEKPLLTILRGNLIGKMAKKAS